MYQLDLVLNYQGRTIIYYNARDGWREGKERIGASELVKVGCIEKANLDDIEGILFVINTSNREAYRNVIPKEHFKEPVVSAEELLDDFKRMEFYVYKAEGRIVGVAALQVEGGKIGRVRWVYVLPGYQRKGIGTALVRHLERKAEELKLEKLWLIVVDGAKWAINFYEKLGYSLKGGIERPWGFDVIMEKALT